MTSSPKEYEYVEFSFTKLSGRRDGKSYDVSAYLLVPAAALPEFTAWQQAPEEARVSAQAMYEKLLANGALLHREDGPAYKEVERSVFNPGQSTVVREENWHEGEKKSGGNGAPHVKSFGSYRPGRR